MFTSPVYVVTIILALLAFAEVLSSLRKRGCLRCW